VPPTPEEEDRRRVSRERRTLVQERTGHVNRIKGLLYSQGVSGYEPLRRDARARLNDLRTGDGLPLPLRLRTEIERELERIELVERQIAVVEDQRDALVRPHVAREGAELYANARSIMETARPRGVGIPPCPPARPARPISAQRRVATTKSGA
jgi:transposase